MPDQPELRQAIAERMARAAGSKAFSKPGPAWDHARSAWLRQASAALAAIQDAYVPPPPGSDRDKLPDYLLHAAEMPPYTSTYCQTGRAFTEAIPTHPYLAVELAEWADQQHRSCRLTRKQDMAPCGCACGHPGRAGSREETADA